MLDSTNILAMSDTATYAMFGVTSLISLFTSGFLVVVYRSQDKNAGVVNGLSKKLEESDERRRVEVGELGERLHAMSTKHIDERFRLVTHSVSNHAQSLTTAMDKVTLRINKSEEEINKLGSLRGASELQLAKAVGELREFVSQCAPTRREFEKVESALGKLDEKVDGLASLSDIRTLLQEIK